MADFWGYNTQSDEMKRRTQQNAEDSRPLTVCALGKAAWAHRQPTCPPRKPEIKISRRMIKYRTAKNRGKKNRPALHQRSGDG
jgi:predicted metal-binding protein